MVPQVGTLWLVLRVLELFIEVSLSSIQMVVSGKSVVAIDHITGSMTISERIMTTSIQDLHCKNASKIYLDRAVPLASRQVRRRPTTAKK